MMHFAFWWKWLLIVSVGYALAGLIIAFFPDGTMLQPHRSATARLFFGGEMSASVSQLRAFLFAPLGATIAGYFLMQSLVVWIPFGRRERWAWHAVAWPLALWFVVDSGLSIYHGALFNVWMVNVWTLILVGLPLAMTYGFFHEPKSLQMRDR